jgi:hypothetical protein
MHFLSLDFTDLFLKFELKGRRPCPDVRSCGEASPDAADRQRPSGER